MMPPADVLLLAQSMADTERVSHFVLRESHGWVITSETPPPSRRDAGVARMDPNIPWWTWTWRLV
jgi:hypothetical protein